jgi:peroxiredoxin family protein
MNNIKVATVGNPGMHIATILGAIPGMSAFATSMMKKEMEKLDIPPIPEFITMIHDAGCEIYGCRATVDMFHLKKSDFCEEVDGVISVGEFYEKAAGAQIIFT